MIDEHFHRLWSKSMLMVLSPLILKNRMNNSVLQKFSVAIWNGFHLPTRMTVIESEIPPMIILSFCCRKLTNLRWESVQCLRCSFWLRSARFVVSLRPEDILRLNYWDLSMGSVFVWPQQSNRRNQRWCWIYYLWQTAETRSVLS